MKNYNPINKGELLDKVKKYKNIVSLQLLWNIDFDYIDLSLSCVVEKENNFSVVDIQKFFPYSYDYKKVKFIIQDVKDASKWICDQLAIELYFPSPNNVDADCPDFIHRNKYYRCEDCDKPIKPKKSDFLPNEVCYNCHLLRERNQKLINDDYVSDERGVTIAIKRGGEFVRNGYISDREYLLEYRFLKEQTNREFDIHPMYSTLFTRKEMIAFSNYLKKIIVTGLEKINSKKNAEEIELTYFSTRWEEVDFDGGKYKLETKRFHRDLFRNVRKYKSINFFEDSIMLIFNNSLKLREDFILRQLYYKVGSRSVNDFLETGDWILSRKDLFDSLKKLVDYDMLKLNQGIASFTDKGELYLKL